MLQNINPAWRCHNNDRVARQFVQPFPREGADGRVPGPVDQGRQAVGNHGGVLLVQLVHGGMVAGMDGQHAVNQYRHLASQCLNTKKYLYKLLRYDFKIV